MARAVSNDHFRADIEGLRAVAVLLVLAFHAGLRVFSGGYAGVDVFFVISGYLITGLLSREIATSGTISLSNFVARRIRRLLPAAAVVLLATLACSTVALPALQMIQTAEAARAAAGYVSNVHFLRQASDYFSGDVRLNPILHTWSVGVEEQFYIAWPLLLLLVSQSARGSARNAARRVAWAFAAIGMFSFLAACWYMRTNPSLAFYAMPLRAWEFACGGLVSLMTSNGELRDIENARATFFFGALGWVGLAAIMYVGVSYSASTEFPGANALLPVAATSVILLAGVPRYAARRFGVTTLLALSPLRWVGRRSYSLYLWHWPVLVLGAAALGSNAPWITPCLCVLALALADLTFRFVETPLRASAQPVQATSAWRTVQIGAAATVTLLLVSEGARQRAVAVSHGPLQRAFTIASKDLGPAYDDGCVNYKGDEQVHVCQYGSPNARTSIVLFGDSHLVQWLPAVQAVARSRGWGVLLIAKTRCATADVPVFIPTTGRRATACEQWRRAAIDTIRARHPAVVLLSNAMCYIRWPGLPDVIPAVSVDVWEGGMLRTLNTLRRSGAQPVLIQATPELHPNVLACLSRSSWLSLQHGACGVDRNVALSAEVAGVERRVIGKVRGTHLVDLTDALCGPDQCTPMLAGKVAYQDGDHLAASMTRLFAPLFAATLDSAVSESAQ